MPTKKKRIGFIPRQDVMKIIDKLSIENNLSNSKIIGILVEEALSIRGIFNKKNGRATQLYQEAIDNSKDLFANRVNFQDNRNFSIKNKSVDDKNPSKTNLLDNKNHDTFDLQTYKKFLSFIKFQKLMDEYES